MRIGVQVSSFTWKGGDAAIGKTFADIGRTADESGFYSFWVMDHFFQIRGIGKPEEPMLEGYSALSYLAGITKQIKLGTLVTGVVYRYPGILVKTATTLDVLSGGRAYLGIGAAWNEDESRALGVPFPPLKQRFEQLEETLKIAHQMFSGDDTSFEGKHHQLGQPMNSPAPLSKPHPPIMIGGGGEKKTLRLVAKYADACNFFSQYGSAVIRQKLDILRGYCDEIGRPYDEIEKTVLALPLMNPDGVMNIPATLQECRNLKEDGIQHVIFGVPNVEQLEPLRIIAREIIPAVADW